MNEPDPTAPRRRGRDRSGAGRPKLPEQKPFRQPEMSYEPTRVLSDDHVEAIHLESLEGMMAMGSGKGPGFCGTHTGIVIDWADGFSRYPQDHKPLNLIERSDGKYLLYPNNYIRLLDKHFTSFKKSDEMQHYRRGERVYWEV